MVILILLLYLCTIVIHWLYENKDIEQSRGTRRKFRTLELRIVLKLEREQAKQFNDNMDKDSHKAISDALKEPAVGYFLKSGRFNH